MEMSADQREIYDFLKQYKMVYVSVNEISKRLGTRHRYHTDRTWARPILRRMEMEGIIESNPFGEYRIRHCEGDTAFLDAMKCPGADLGDTTIINIRDVEPS